MPLCVMAAGATDLGRRRQRNEDRFAIVPHHRLFVVADGMGGHRCGATASRVATDTIIEFFRRSGSHGFEWPAPPDPRLSLAENRLLWAIRAANSSVYEQGLESRECKGMGSTVVASVFDPLSEHMIVGHVGDSRAYRVRAREITRMTRDHSLTGESAPPNGGIWFERFAKNALTRALGLSSDTIVDLRKEPVNVGDVFVLCSDGLTSLVADQQILELILAAPHLQQACASLIERANGAGGDDNITVVVMRVI
jgi:serine/threonine protein phosphatase PrpC